MGRPTRGEVGKEAGWRVRVRRDGEEGEEQGMGEGERGRVEG